MDEMRSPLIWCLQAEYSEKPVVWLPSESKSLRVQVLLRRQETGISP